jgi:uncharacterized membrane protein YozB (DUF420 family)
MEKIPALISIGFILTTALTIYFFSRAANHSKKVLWIIGSWLVFQAALALTGFYTETRTVPPRFIVAILPPLAAIAIMFSFKKGRSFIQSLDLKWLTILHVVRIPVELVLFGLFVYKLVPVQMTFEGLNADILSGLTAPVIYYLLFYRKRKFHQFFLVWNILCLVLLINIVTIAILSAPLPFQQMGFDQPNVGVFLFPFIWLPSIIVPLVLFSHLVCIYRLVRKKKLSKGTAVENIKYAA